MKIGIFGGTYNPPHLGHMAAAKAAIETLHLDKLLLIPDRIPPHKELPENPVSNQDRLAMTRIMGDRLDCPDVVEVSDLEMHRTGKSYTADTLRQLRQVYPTDELWLMMGTDMFLTLHSWYQPEEILKRSGILTFGRNRADTIDLFDRQTAFLEAAYGTGVRVQVIDLPGLVEVSSTQLRQALANGGGQDYLDPSIYGYILRKGLYGTHADLKALSLPDLRAVSYSMIYSKRVPHVQGTEWEAAELAKRWGADETDARKAAILHDCTKYWSLAKQLSKCAEYGILLDRVEQKTLPLLHSKTAAAVAERMFGMPQDICQAICWHTTGKADMTLLEKIIYIADYAEPHRSWSEEAHGLAMKDLDAGVLLGLENTIKFTQRQGREVHYRTIEARDWLRSQGVKLPGEP